MESTRPSSSTVRISRGISARACVAKTMAWTLESAKGVLAHDAIIVATRHHRLRPCVKLSKLPNKLKPLKRRGWWVSYSQTGSKTCSKVWLGGRIRVNSWNELIKIGTTSTLEVEAKSLALTLADIRHVILKPTPGLGRLRVVGLASHVAFG
jgi:hypothetical protein